MGWGGLVLSVGNTAALSVAGFRRRRHHLAAGPVDEIRALSARIRDDCTHVIASGGVITTWFLDDARRGTDAQLDDLSKRTDDEQLAGLLAGAATTWRQGFGHAPGPPSPRVHVVGEPYHPDYAEEDRARAASMGNLVEAMRETMTTTEAAVDRLNKLARRL
ncbi:MAG: hypothetical protein JWL79_2923 [Frankiales bacterium]|nr:hypothetical protein [Frankiales bacterium]